MLSISHLLYVQITIFKYYYYFCSREHRELGIKGVQVQNIFLPKVISVYCTCNLPVILYVSLHFFSSSSFFFLLVLLLFFSIVFLHKQIFCHKSISSDSHAINFKLPLVSCIPSFLSVVSSYFAVVFALPRVQMPQVVTQAHAELH
jgi:hypothetical protein